MSLQMSDLADLVCGTTDGFQKALDRHNLTDEDLTELLLTCDVEQCPGCGWWVESWELIPLDENEPDGHCENCRL